MAHADCKCNREVAGAIAKFPAVRVLPADVLPPAGSQAAALRQPSRAPIKAAADERTASWKGTPTRPRETGRDVDAAQRRLFLFLDSLGIAHRTRRHDPVFTVAQAKALRDDIPGGHTKNLFLKDKKDNYFLVSLEEDAEVDLKSVHGLIGARSRVSFGKPDKLMEYLGVVPGSVTLLGVINDSDRRVQVVIDAALLEHEVVNMHPLCQRRDNLDCA